MEFIIKDEINEDGKNYIISNIQKNLKATNVKIIDNKLIFELNEVISEKHLKQAIKNLLFSAKNIKVETEYNNNINTPFKEDPLPHLKTNNEVGVVGKGLFAFQGDFLKVFRSLNEYFLKLALKHNAIDQEYPVLWPVDLYKKTDYINEFPQQVILCSHVKDDFNTLENFSELYKKNKDYNKIACDNNLDDIEYGVQSSVCVICYYLQENEVKSNNKVYTIYNKVFRKENSESENLDRLTNFTVRDIMFVGDESFVIETRDKLMQDIIDFIKEMNFNCKIETANDPFFLNENTIKNVFQYSANLKYEILAKINFMDKYIAVGSINNHLDFYGNAFNIKDNTDKKVHSGCIGIGFERLTFALYSQFGPDISKWPSSIKNTLYL